MRRSLLVVALLGITGLAAVGNPILSGAHEGFASYEVLTGELSIETELTLTASWETFVSEATIFADATGPRRLLTETAGVFDGLSLALETAFDIQTASFASAEVTAATPIEGGDLALTCVIDGGFGLGLSLAGDGVLSGIDVGFNLDPYGRVQTEGCALPFTFASAEATISVTDCITIDAELLIEDIGFVELYLASRSIGGLPFGVQFAASLLFEPQTKSLDLSPSFTIEGSECIDLYAGLVWDADAKTISGIEIYGVGLRCELGAVDVRGLWSLAPDMIALVPSPYWALLGIILDIALPCEIVGEASGALFFGGPEDALFDLGAIVGEVVLPLSEASTLSLAAEIPIDGAAVFTLGWDVRF